MDQFDRASDKDSQQLKRDSDGTKKLRYATKRAFLVTDMHCSAPSSSPRSSPVDPSLLADFTSNELNDVIRTTYSRCKNNDTLPLKQEDENGEWWIQLDELQTRTDKNDSTLQVAPFATKQVQASMSPEGGGESMSTKSELEDVVESMESPQSKFDMDEDDERAPYPSTPSKRQNVGHFHDNLGLNNVPDIPFPSVFRDSSVGTAMSSSAPASTVGSSATTSGPLPRPNTFDVRASPSAHAELNTLANERPPEWEDFDELPSIMLTRLFDQLHRTRWVVPVLPNQELEALMEIAIVLIKRGTDKTSKFFDGFLEKGLLVAFDKLMNDEAMKDWKVEIHRYIWLSVARFLVMFTEKLRQTLAAEDFHFAYWKILQYALSSNSRYALKLPSFLFNSVNFHMQNFGRRADFLQMQFDPHELLHFTNINNVEDVHQRVLQLWLLLLLNHFGKIGGFALMKNFLKRNINETTKITNYIDWLRPFASCSLLLKPSLVTETFGSAITAAATRLEQVDDKELKCETVKGDLNESPYVELAKLLQSLVLISPEMLDLARQMQFFSLRYILRVLQVAPFAGRIAALEELHMVLHNAASEFRQHELVVSMNDLTTWLRKQHLIEILVRDNLHHPAYCERLERVFRVLLERNAVTIEEMDILWNAQRGKHDVIQRNVHDLIAKLVNVFNSVLQEHLFHCMKECWVNSSSRERTLLLDLIRRIGVDFNNLAEKDLTVKSLSLLWDLFRDEHLPVEMVDAALEAHFNVLENAGPAEELRRQYIERCIDELLLDSVFVLPTLKHMQRLMILMPECDYSTSKKVTRAEFIATVQQETELCSRLSRNVALYMEKVRNAVVGRPQLHGATDSGALMFDGRYTHSDHLRIRLGFLHFLLSDGQLWLMTPQANELWDALVVKSVFEYERTYGFQLFGTMQGQEDIDPKALDQFFNSRILQLPVELLNEEGFSCFKIFWIAVNKKHNKLFQPTEGIDHYLFSDFDLEGMDYLWEIMLQARSQVSQMAVTFWVEILSNPHIGVISDFAHLIQMVVSKCFVMLKTKHDDLIKGNESEEEKMKMLDRMGRILTALNSYICAFDDDCCILERAQQPLRKAALGRCFVLPIVFPGEQLFQMRRYLNHKFANGIDFNSAQDEEHGIPVHSTMPLLALKLKIDDRLRFVDGCSNDGALVPVQLTVQRINPPETKILQPSDRRKTLDELGIDAGVQIIVRFPNQTCTWTNRLGSTDSSPDQTFLCDEGTTPNNEENERILPGSVIAANPDHVRFLYTLADIGSAYGNSYLRKAATDVLYQIPADTMSLSLLHKMVESGRLYDLLPAESSNHVLHLLRVLHSLLLPCSGHFMTAATEFQIIFLTSSSCLAVFSFLKDPQVLCRWDTFACTSVVWRLANIAKFVLFVAARLKNLRIFGGSENGYFETDRIIGREQSIFKELCCIVARDLYRRSEENPVLVEHISQLFDTDGDRIECLLRLAWAAGSRRIPLQLASGDLARDSSINSILDSQPANFITEEPTECLLDAFAIAVVSNEATSAILDNKHLWNLLVSDLLFCGNSTVRRYFAVIARRMICRLGAAEKQLATVMVQLLFNKLEESDEKLPKNMEFFILLCRLLDHCRNNHIPVDDVMRRSDGVLDWLDHAKQHTVANQESYPEDDLLIGRLDVCRSLLGFLTNEQKVLIGSKPNGTQLVKQLLDEFILPSSRAYVDLMRQNEENDAYIIQRSLTHSAISKSEIDDAENLIPRSATMEPMISSRSVPVCGTNESVKAAYNLLLALCDMSPHNYQCLVENLLELFYSGPVPTVNIEWEYMPGYSVRSPNSYVGLKNGGATCYMNSVFQQIFMIEPLRKSIINVTFPDNVSTEEMIVNDCEDIPEEQYHITILKAVQSIFAHLLGSEMQFYSPKFFWKHFRFCGQAVNVREQQDALEFYNALFDTIDEGMKKLGEYSVCEKLFGGTFADQKICIDCPHRYQREETFTSISVDVRSHNNLLDSLKEYVKGDLLNNDNAYLCEECNKKVSAVKRLCVARLPPYLTIQLKRFDFDWERDLPQKFNDYFEFPIDLDMMPFTAYGLAQAEVELSKEELTHSTVTDSGRGTSESASPETNDAFATVASSASELKVDDNNSTKYRLRGVIVHSGQANGGHYYSFIRSEEDGGRWFKFDDIDVTEWQLNREEMRNMWFGGDCIAESFDNSSTHYQKKRQKRWWNAYLLIYEKVSAVTASVSSLSAELTTSCSSTLPSHSPISSSNSPLNLDKKIGAMSISTRIRQMPPKLEALIRGKNTCAMHERSQYTANYFQFIRDICSRAILLIECLSANIREDYYVLTTKLLSKFLFSTGLRAKKTLRSGNGTEWLKIYDVLFKQSKCARGWFICNIVFQSKLIVLYLLTAPSSDVRYFFINLFVMLLDATRYDYHDVIRPYMRDCPEFKLETVYVMGDTVSDMLINLLLVIPRNYFSEFSSHPTQYIILFNLYALMGLEQAKQLVRKDALHSLLVLISRDEYRIKIIYQDSSKLYEVISVLLRTCEFEWQNKDTGANPYAVSTTGLIKAPLNVTSWLKESEYVNRLLKQLVELPTDHVVALDTVLFLSWENIEFSKIFLCHFSFESMFTPNEVRNAAAFIEDVLSIQDSIRKERHRLALLGFDNETQKHKGVIAIMFGQRDLYAWKAYHLLRMFVDIVSKDLSILEIVSENAQARGNLYRMDDWFKRQLPALSPDIRSCDRSNELKTSTEVEGADIAVDLYRKFHELILKLADSPIISTTGEDVPGISGERRSSCGSDESLQAAEWSSFDYKYETISEASSPRSTNDPLDAEISSKKESFDEELAVGTSISAKEKLEANIGLPPPPPYSEHEPATGVGSIQTCLHIQPPVSSLDTSHSWRISNRPTTTNHAKNEDVVEESPIEFTSTGVEMEDAPPPYHKIIKE